MSNMSTEQLTNKERKQIVEESNMIFNTAYNKLSLELGKLVSESHQSAPKIVISLGELLSAYYELSNVYKSTTVNTAVLNSGTINEKQESKKKKRKKYVTKGAWTADEDAYLRENHGRMTLKEISEKIGRTPKAVSMRCYNTGIIGNKKKTVIESINTDSINNLNSL